MDKYETAVAVYPNHEAADKAIKTLAAAGFEMKNLSLVGKGYHSDEKVVGFYNTGDRIKFWGSRGAFWGGFWGILVVLGYLAAVVFSGLETAIVVGGLSALGAALYSLGIPKNSVLQYETDLKADNFLVMARGPAAEVERAKTLLATSNPSRFDVHATAEPEAATSATILEHA